MQFKVDSAPVMSELLSLEQKASDMTPVMMDIGDLLVESVHKNFEHGGRPGTWEPRKDNNPWPLLMKTGELYNSIEANASQNDVYVDAGAEYGVYHNEGTSTIPQREFLVIQDEDLAAIDEMIFQYFS